MDGEDMTIRDIDKMSEIEIILDNLFWLGFKLCMAGKLETAPNESLAEAEQAINAYILGEVMELIGADVNQLWVEDDSFCMKCDFELVDGTRNCKCVSHNLLRQELRNKANERWG
jgi:hypothetical protein